MIDALPRGTDPVGLPGLAVFAASVVVFASMLLLARSRRERDQDGSATRSRASMVGIAVQTVAFLLASSGAQRVTLDPLGGKALAEAAAIAVLMVTAATLFFWASHTMGRNWSLVARTRDDHQLIRTGPFAHLRHPIYTALCLLLVAMAIAFGHTGRLWLALPVYALGTWLRVKEEERLLRAMFGAAHDDYAARVKRFVPGLF